MEIELRSVSKSYGGHAAVDGVSFTAPAGGLTALVGPSGSGKTTLLRLMSGLAIPNSGSVHIGGVDATFEHPRDRGVGYVFQHYALFRNMTVFENVAFGMRVKPKRFRKTNAEIRSRVGELLELVQLDAASDRHPAQLSGGQQQRVALARALGTEPRILLLDEPFGALDAAIRVQLRNWLRRLHERIHVTSVLVTHDQQEAFEIADKLIVANAGRIEQEGTPNEVRANPATEFVRNFIAAALPGGGSALRTDLQT